jgi:hypothetical protein
MQTSIGNSGVVVNDNDETNQTYSWGAILGAEEYGLMDDLFSWLDRLAPELNIVPFRHIDCPRCGAWIALVSYAGPDDTTGRERVLAGLARATQLPTYLITVESTDDFTAVIHTLHPPDSKPISTAEQFRIVLTQLSERHACTP